jgi:hypothetical protein
MKIDVLKHLNKMDEKQVSKILLECEEITRIIII